MQMMMQAGAFALSLAMVLGTSRTEGQTPKRVNPVSLTQALSSFSTADADHDGRISLEEARAIPVSAESFRAEDENGDGFWSRDEFLVFYHRQLSASGQRADADLEAEIARLQALKRVRAVEQTSRLTAETSARCANAASINERFESALADLEKKCSARRATRDDFQRLRNLVILNGRVADRTASTGNGTPPQSALLETLDRIERGNALGQSTSESFRSLHSIVAGSAADRAPTPEPARTSILPVAAQPAAGKIAPGALPAGPADARQRAQPKVEPRTERPNPPAPIPAPAPPFKKPFDQDKADRSRP
jgi:EF hand